MSHYWEVIAPVTIAGFGALVYVRHRLVHPAGTRRAGRDTPPPARSLPAMVATVPVAAVDGKPPWALAYERSLDWAARNELLPPEPLPRASDPAGWVSGGTEPTAAEVAASRALHGYIPELDTDIETSALLGQEGPGAAQANPDAGQMEWPRRSGPGESEGYGLTAPPAPSRLASEKELALARCDLFMAAMRADHERWLSVARERWAAA